ncbi:MAG: DNA mismatch repair protein MutS, partial [Natronomonas sp.]
LHEVGRGTSTRDGYAIAQAATEYLHDEIGSYTLFATHHHELTDVAATLPQASNYHFSAARTADGVEFEHDLRGGPAEASYGVEVAEMAGVPGDVVDRAGGLLDDKEMRTSVSESDRITPEMTTTDGGREALLAELESVDLAETTPLEALNLLSELQSSIE